MNYRLVLAVFVFSIFVPALMAVTPGPAAVKKSKVAGKITVVPSSDNLQRVTGDISSVDLPNKTITVKVKNETVKLVLLEKTRVVIGSKMEKQQVLKEKMKVVVYYIPRNGKNEATRISIEPVAVKTPEPLKE
ncbi:MAG: hypothetical protein A2252_08635 [Elusimicrobia bacterium RIFOXYA2_FULL_39_19]|nr:MAG: hypothetical protein A2252_08635 [Elusimicrobia bacterium RIFOXYA2_FULL_39_19]